MSLNTHRLQLCSALLILWGLQLFIFRWGVVTPDTVFQYGQALTGRYDDWHPPVTAWLWRQLHRVHDGTAPILIFDSLLYWTGIGLIADHFLRRGQWLMAALTVGIGALPFPFGQMGAILKDPLLTAVLLASVGLFLFARRNTAIIVLGLMLLVLASATRFNAVFASAPLLLVLVPPRWITDPRKLIATIVGGLLIFGTTSWLIDDVALKPHHSRPFVSLLNFDLAGIVGQGGANPYPQIDEDDARTFARQCYSPRLYNAGNSDACSALADSLDDWLRRHGESPIHLWLRSVTGQPLPWIEHRIAHLNWNWRGFVPWVPNDAVYIMSQPNSLGIGFHAIPGAKLVSAAGQVMAVSPLGRPATWIAVAIGLLIIAPALASRQAVTALACSSLLYGSAYALISVAPDLRYNLWTLVAAMIGLVFALSEWPTLEALPRRRLILGVLPATIVSIGEIAAVVAG